MSESAFLRHRLSNGLEIVMEPMARAMLADDPELAEEFFRAFAMNSRMTIHIVLRYGSNAHHCIEVMFKAFARALSRALALDPGIEGVPSTKGVIET